MMAATLSAQAPAPSSALDLLRFEELLSDLSATFISLPPQAFDQAIQDSLKRIVAALGVDRSTLNRVCPLTGRIESSHSFAVEGVVPVPIHLPARQAVPWSTARSLAHEPTIFARLDDLPPEASVDKETLRGFGIKSHVTMPIVVAGQFRAALSFGCVRTERSWPEELLGRLRLLANIFGSAIARRDAHEQLESAIRFEQLASSILASLLLVDAGSMDLAITRGLRQIGEFVEAEHVGLWGLLPAQGGFRSAQHWHADAWAIPLPLGDSPDLPWLGCQIAAGRTVRLTRLGDLPDEAGRDRAALVSAGVRSLLVVPISVSDRVSSALSIASMQKDHEWPDALMPGVGLLAEVFGSLHARQTAERRKLDAELEATHWRERLAHLVRVHTAGEMSVALAHEITQPLGAIENYALAARRRAVDPAPDVARVTELLDKVIGQATRAGEVVTRMRSMVQRHEPDVKLIDIEGSIAECIGMVKMDCALRGIEIHLSVGSGLPLVSVDEIHLQQVALNLLRNAMEAVEQGCHARRITIGIALNEQEEIQVEVADAGCGIAEGDLERIFESFYTTKASGLGVGLAICRKLIEAHGGKLWASHNPRGGAIFRFTIPVSAAAD